jgi:hypothetical protein
VTNPRFRIFRTWEWRQVRVEAFGGRPGPWHCVPKDELQTINASGEWEPVPIVEAEKPESPDVARERERAAALRRDFTIAFEKMQASINPVVTVATTPPRRLLRAGETVDRAVRSVIGSLSSGPWDGTFASDTCFTVNIEGGRVAIFITPACLLLGTEVSREYTWTSTSMINEIAKTLAFLTVAGDEQDVSLLSSIFVDTLRVRVGALLQPISWGASVTSRRRIVERYIDDHSKAGLLDIVECDPIGCAYTLRDYASDSVVSLSFEEARKRWGSACMEEVVRHPRAKRAYYEGGEELTQIFILDGVAVDLENSEAWIEYDAKIRSRRRAGPTSQPDQAN